MPRAVRWVASATLLFFLLASNLPAQSPPKQSDAMVPMRDGVKLYTTIFAPKEIKAPLPIVFLRTPYGADRAGPGFLRSYLADLAKEEYIFAFQDIRGRFRSEGTFVMQRSPRDRKDAKAIDESTDAYDTIEWLVKHAPKNNGRVGMLGISYDGWTTAMAMLDPHPALKAVSPQASPADMFMGDDFHHNGAFRLSYGFEYAALLETNKTNTDFTFDKRDTYEWYLRLGALPNANARYFHEKIPTWNDFVAHPNYDAFWQRQAMAPYLKQVSVPTLTVAGWWDQEDFFGPQKMYSTMEPKDQKKRNFVVVGPWNHGGWANGLGNRLGKFSFDSSTAKHFRENVQAPWFAYWLKDKGKGDFPEALMFETGSNKWVRHEEWPPKKKAKDRPLYFHADGKLSFDPPAKGPGKKFDSYLSDPARPVPYRPRPILPTYQGPGWTTWLLEDQRFVHQRPDVLSWETEPLKEDLTVAGNAVAHLFASTSGTDCDWIVKLIDVYPEDYSADRTLAGYQLMIANEVLRGRFRKSFVEPSPLKPNVAEEFTVDVHWVNHCFRKGHKVMVQVQSTWFPLIDRNPQKYVPNIFAATDADFQIARQKVYRTPKQPSHVVLPVLSKP